MAPEPRISPTGRTCCGVIVGHETANFATDDLVEISANIDDLNPQIYGHLSDRLFSAGARDVTVTPTIMKKGRPAVTLAVLAEAAARDHIAQIIFSETSTIGLRFHTVSRLKLKRQTIEVETRFGMIRVKVSGAAASPMTVAPEYDDCQRAALAHGAPLKLVMEEALAAARRQARLRWRGFASTRSSTASRANRPGPDVRAYSCG